MDHINLGKKYKLRKITQLFGHEKQGHLTPQSPTKKNVDKFIIKKIKKINKNRSLPLWKLLFLVEFELLSHWMIAQQNSAVPGLLNLLEKKNSNFASLDDKLNELRKTNLPTDTSRVIEKLLICAKFDYHHSSSCREFWIMQSTWPRLTCRRNNSTFFWTRKIGIQQRPGNLRKFFL